MRSRLTPPFPATMTRAVRAVAVAATAALFAACADSPTATTPVVAGPDGVAATGYAGGYQLTFENIGTSDQTATIVADPRSVAPAGLRTSRSATSAFLAPGDRGLTPRPAPSFPLDIDRISTGFYTVGTRGAGDAYRYVYALFRVRNRTALSVQNLVLVGITTPSTFGGTAISNIKLPGDVVPNGTTSANLALGMAPAGASVPGRTGAMTAWRSDVLQLFSEAEIAAAQFPAPYGPLPYGFTVIDTVADGRTIPGTLASGTYPGLMLFAFRLPLQATASQDVMTFTYNYFAASNAETQVSESYQEQDATASAAAATRANNIGATALNIFRNGSSLAGNPIARTFCTIRTAGTQAAPTQLLGDACSIEYLNPALTVPANATVAVGANTSIAATVNVRPGFSPPTTVSYVSANPAIANVSSTGMVSGVSAGSTTIYVSLYSTGAYLYSVPVTVTP